MGPPSGRKFVIVVNRRQQACFLALLTWSEPQKDPSTYIWSLEGCFDPLLRRKIFCCRHTATANIFFGFAETIRTTFQKSPSTIYEMGEAVFKRFSAPDWKVGPNVGLRWQKQSFSETLDKSPLLIRTKRAIFVSAFCKFWGKSWKNVLSVALCRQKKA